MFCMRVTAIFLIQQILSFFLSASKQIDSHRYKTIDADTKADIRYVIRISDMDAKASQNNTDTLVGTDIEFIRIRIRIRY